MKKTFLSKTAEAWEKELGNMDVCCNKVLNLEELMSGSLYREREMVVEIQQKNGQKMS